MIDPNFVNAYYNRAQVYRQWNHHKKAIEDYTSVIKRDPAFYRAWNNRGCRYEKLKKYDDALSDYNQAIQLQPSVFHLNNRASLLLKMGGYQEALVDYSEIIKLEPGNIDAHKGKGIIFMMNNQYNNALVEFNYCLHLEKDKVFAPLFSVIAAAEISEAKYLKQKEKLKSVNGTTPWGKGILDVYMGKLDAEKMFVSKVIEDKEQNRKELFITYFYIGMEYINRGERVRGKRYLQSCLKYGKNSEYMYKLAKEKLNKD